MADSTDLTNRISSINNFRGLHNSFAEILASATVGGESSALAKVIDDMIFRLETERGNDAETLRGLREEFEYFQQHNKGIVGWFKRKLPFTATHHQELELNDKLTNAKAELLADRMVIARTQVLKERFLAPTLRVLGQRPANWRDRIKSSWQRGDLEHVGAELEALAAERDRSTGFVSLVDREVEAFADAVFTAAEDIERKRADLTAARSEVAELRNEVETEIGLLKEELHKVSKSLVSELESSVAAFHADGLRAARIWQLQSFIENALTAVMNLEEAAAPLSKLVSELHSLPRIVSQLQHSLKTLNQQRNDRIQNVNQVFARHEELTKQVDDAKREVENKKNLLQHSYQLIQTLRGQHSSYSMNPMYGSTENSTEETIISQAQKAVKIAESNLSNLSGPVSEAKRAVERARTSVNSLENEIQKQHVELEAAERRLPFAKLEFQSGLDRTRAAMAAATAALGTYLSQDSGKLPDLFRTQNLAGGRDWLSSRGIESSLAGALTNLEHEPAIYREALQVIRKISDWLQSQRKETDVEMDSIQARRNALWKSRLRAIVGDALTNEAIAAGMHG